MKKQIYAGLFMVALATMMYEILLTRIFSVTMWYHFAFMAISVAMFGMTVGALLVYLLPNLFTQERTKYLLGWSSLLLSVFAVLSFLTHLSIPVFSNSLTFSIVGLYSLLLTYVVISLPFVFSGIAVCLALTKFPTYVGKLYAADLAGAAAGCLFLVYCLKITDGPTAVFVVALIASLGALFFIAGENYKKLFFSSLILSALLMVFVLFHTKLVNQQRPLLRLIWAKGEIESRPLYEKWNSFSRVRVWGSSRKPETPFGWGISSTYKPDETANQLHMNIDAHAHTVLTAFNGDLQKLDYLKYDITNLAHYLRSNANVCVIGSGGGRDILSALTFDQKSVTGVEINENIVDAVNRRFGDFTGHLDKNPKVRFVTDEARSYLTRSQENFDIIQSSLIDTWAATAAGAYVFTESSLYTVEAWNTFLQHLTPNGILSFSRWNSSNKSPAYRLDALAQAALAKTGIANPRQHIIMVERPNLPNTNGIGLITILVSKSPYSEADLNIIEQVARTLQFDIVLSPRFAQDATFANLASGRNLAAIYAQSYEDITPPTDDRPFFFFPFKLKNLISRELWANGIKANASAVPIIILCSLLLIVTVLTFLCIIIPLALTTRRAHLRGSLPLFLYFSAIGIGFMLIEISQMQRLIIVLGHPIYGLAVVLFALLLSSGLGSFATQGITPLRLRQSGTIPLGLLLGILVIFGILTPAIMSRFPSSTAAMRICAATAILFPLGLFMGMAFPLGMKTASSRAAALTPWLWGINGATSVLASVLATVIALLTSITTSFWTGFFFYVLAFLSFVWANRQRAT